MLRPSVLLLSISMICSLSINEASADPQILAAVPPGQPLYLTCDGTKCIAEFSSICLQQQRDFPAAGTIYQIAREDIGDVHLVGTGRSGEKVNLPVSLLNVKSQRSHTAVRFYVDQISLDERGVGKTSIMFDRLVALYPQKKSQPDMQSPPHSDQDKEIALSGIERIETMWAEINADKMILSRLINRLANYLPLESNLSQSKVKSLFSHAVDQEQTFQPVMQGEAKRLVMNCQQRTGMLLRKCLGTIHDQVMRDVNLNYWNMLKPGS